MPEGSSSDAPVTSPGPSACKYLSHGAEVFARRRPGDVARGVRAERDRVWRLLPELLATTKRRSLVGSVLDA